MKIETIELSWFRGAANSALLDTKGKSVVIYGENGAGKSSFVDAIEYALRKGRITHLSHEFSGRHQEKAIHNIHKPEDAKTIFKIKFSDKSELETEIDQSGKFSTIGDGWALTNKWNYRRTVLRQNEVSEFIHDTKGDKYSALLPLFGLDEIVHSSDNLHELIKSTETKSKLELKRSDIENADAKRKKIFGAASDQEIANKINGLYSLYCPDGTSKAGTPAQIAEIEQAIQSRIDQSAYEYEKYSLLQKISNLELRQNISAVRQANSKIAENVDPLITEKLEVLKSTITFAKKMGAEEDLVCPACGCAIKSDVFHSHIEFEQRRLKEVININTSRRSAINALYDNLKNIKTHIKTEHLSRWRDMLSSGIFSKNVAYLDTLDIEKIHSSCDEMVLAQIEELLLPIVNAAALESQNTAPDTKKLITDKDMVEEEKSVVKTNALKREVAQIDETLTFLGSLEQNIRDELNEQIKMLISEISIDIKRMWTILHPNEAITDIRLYIPDDEEKALDICLKFHGIDQPSPRNTLSEGYRNSLGLSIFLSMAKRGPENDHPLFLDDVIVSLDRNHRGMVVDLLEKEFSDRQVFIFTHDRVWFTELHLQLDEKNWDFKTLLPYESPELGIRWSHTTSTFDKARLSLQNRPDTAGNDARKIMDTELALIAEKLKINFPFVRGEKNDLRMAHDFLERIISSGAKNFQKRKENVIEYDVYSDAIKAFEEADKLILSWGNRGSHTFDLVKSEAEKLIMACEKALGFFTCPSCKKKVWYANANDLVQCQCSMLRWKSSRDLLPSPPASNT